MILMSKQKEEKLDEFNINIEKETSINFFLLETNPTHCRE